MKTKIKKVIWGVVYCISSILFTRRISGKNNVIKSSGVLFLHSRIDIKGNNNKIIVGSNTRLNNQLILIIGDNNTVVIGKACYLKGKKIHVEGNSCNVFIGDETTIESAEIACTENNTEIKIGKDCMFADDIDIRNGDSHSIINIKTGKRINYSKDIFIGDHVWITSHATILKGVKISDNSIVASGSVVTKDVSQNSICAGIPAKVIKTGVTWKRERMSK